MKSARVGYRAMAATPNLVSSKLALFVLVLSARLGLVAYAGSPLPFYDQWLAEFNNTFLQGVAGSGIFEILSTPHNEHVIATTKLCSLLGFFVNGYWDLRFLLVVAAVVRAAEACVLLGLLSNGLSGSAKTATWWVCAAGFIVPFSGYNSVCGLQVCFYFAELGMLVALHAVVHWTDARRGVGQLLTATVFALASLGSSVAIPVATLACHLAVRRPRPGFWPA